MTLAAAFSELYQQLAALQKLLSELHTTVVEDRPLRNEPKIVEQFDTATLDGRGYLEDALAAARDGRESVIRHYDLDRARRSLVTCFEQFDLFLDKFWSNLSSYERVTTLDRIGLGRGREWIAWANVVGDTLTRCQEHVNQVYKSLFACWQEIAERQGTTSVSVQATNIGQQITAPEGWEGLQQSEST